MYIAQAWLRGYWNWICVGTGRDWQLFQNKKVQFCCRGRFLSSARMELFFLTIWHLGPEPKWNFASKWPLKFDFGAGDIPFWREIRFWRRIQLLYRRKRNSILAEEKKTRSAAKLGGLCSEKNWIFFIQYTYMSGPNKPSIRLVLCILAVLEGQKEKNPRKQTLSPDPLPQWAREPD